MLTPPGHDRLPAENRRCEENDALDAAAAKRLRSSDDRLSYVAETISSVIGKLDDADPLAGPGVTADRADGDVSRRSGE
jgi:hypothetical protein